MTTLEITFTSLGKMGRTYRHEKDWGRSPNKNNKRKNKGNINHSPSRNLTQEDYEEEFETWDRLELEALDEEYNDRHKRN